MVCYVIISVAKGKDVKNVKAHIEVYRGNSGEIDTLVSEAVVNVSGHEEAQKIVDKTHVKDGYMIGYWLEDSEVQ